MGFEPARARGACSRRTITGLGGASPTRRAVGNGACLRRPRGRTPSSPIPLGSFRFASVRVVRADRRASAPFASRPTARRCISPLPSSENTASTDGTFLPSRRRRETPLRGGKALGKHAWGSVTRLELHTDAVRCLAELPAAIFRNVGLVSGRRLRRGGVASSVRSDRVPDRGHGVRESHANARGDARVGHLPRRLSTVHRGRG